MQGAPQERAGQVLRSRILPNNALNPTGIKLVRTVQMQRLIDSTDKQIDALPHELYNLTPEEIAVVQNASN